MNRREAGMLFFGVMFGALLSIVLGILMEPKLPKPDQPIMTQDTSHWLTRELPDGSWWTGTPEAYARDFPHPTGQQNTCYGIACLGSITSSTQSICLGPKCDELKKAMGGE